MQLDIAIRLKRAFSHFLPCVKEKSHDHNSKATASRPREEHSDDEGCPAGYKL